MWIGIPKHFLRPRERPPWSPPAPLSPATPPERPGARRCTALRGLGWCWTDAAGWGRVAPQGCPGATASGRATGKAWEGHPTAACLTARRDVSSRQASSCNACVNAEALQQAARLREAGVFTLMGDTAQGAMQLGLAQCVAAAAGSPCLRLADLAANTLALAIRLSLSGWREGATP